MKQLLIIAAFMMIAATPNQSHAEFASKADMVQALVSTLGSVIRIPGGNGSPNIQVTTLRENGDQVDVALSSFAKKTRTEKLIPQLNYVNNETMLMGLYKKIAGASFDLAYQVNETMICYKSGRDSSSYVDCYAFPQGVDNALEALRSANVIK